MAIELLRPNGNGTETSIASEIPSGNDHYTLVDEVTADDLSTCIYTSSYLYQRDLYALPDSVGSGTINGVTVYGVVRCDSSRSTDSCRAKLACRTHGTNYEGPEQTIHGSLDWSTLSQSWATNPNTSEAWTWDEIDSLEIGACLAKNSKLGYLTQVYVEIDYTDESVAKTSADSGSGAEAVSGSGLSLFAGDSGSGVEVVTGSALVLQTGDSGTGSEGSQNVLAALADSETGLAAETANLDVEAVYEVFGTDAGTGNDGLSQVLAALFGSEYGSAGESAGLAGASLREVFGSDAGNGREALGALIEFPKSGGGMRLWT